MIVIIISLDKHHGGVESGESRALAGGLQERRLRVIAGQYRVNRL
ncbi:hypothetical protein [Stenotrophomonas sp.]